MGIWAVFRGFQAVRTPKRCSRTPRSIKRYPRECRGHYFRLLPTAGVCNQHIRVLIRLLPTAGLCNWYIRAVFRLLPTTGVRNQLFVQYWCMLSAWRGVNYAQFQPVCGYVDNTIFDIDQMTVAETPIFYPISMKLQGKIPYMQNS